MTLLLAHVGCAHGQIRAEKAERCPQKSCQKLHQQVSCLVVGFVVLLLTLARPLASKKGKKKKVKAVSLNDFLSDKKSTDGPNWADATDDIDPSGKSCVLWPGAVIHVEWGVSMQYTITHCLPHRDIYQLASRRRKATL